jgi:autotransporter-associated beta strand protein
MNPLRSHKLAFISAIVALAPLARAQSTWTGAAGNQNWSTPENWSSGIVPNNTSVTFPDGVFPVTTNVQGSVNNVVAANTQIASLSFNNNGAANNFDTTLIPAGVTLTVAGNITVSPGTTASVASFAGGGTLIGGTNGNSTLQAQATLGTAVLDLSQLSNFVFNAGGAGGPINLGTGSSTVFGALNLAAASNNITATTLAIGNNNSGGLGALNLGNGTNIINADVINIGFDKTSGSLQFLNHAGGGLKIADHTGNGRAKVSLGGRVSSGSDQITNTGVLLLDGGTVNIMADTLILGDRGARNGAATVSGNGVLSFNSGVVDATTIAMATNATAGAQANGTISVGGNGVTGGMLRIGAGGFSMVAELSSIAALNLGTLNVSSGGSVICSNNIYKITSKGTASINLNSATLIMQSLVGTIGMANGNPIDNFSVTNSSLTLPVGTTPSVAVLNLNVDATTQNTVNIGSLPSVETYPSQYPVISYAVVSGNPNTLVLGSVPRGFMGYLSNNLTTLTIDLVITNGPPPVKTDTWGGGINSQWDTSTLNWTNNGVAVNYNEADFVIFDDTAHTADVDVTGARQPATLTFNNSSLNYTLHGAGKISGAVQLVKNGGGSLVLAETGGDDFSLGFQVNNGTVILDNANGTITGGLIISGGTLVQIGNNDANGALPAGPLSNDGTLVFNQTKDVVISTVIPGGGALVQDGVGVLSLSASNTYSGGTMVNRGTLALTNAGSIASSAFVSVSNATLDVSGVSATATRLSTLALTNANLNLKVGYLQTNFSAGSLILGGSANTINVRALPPIASYPATIALLQSDNSIVGYNFVIGNLPAASPAYAGSLSLSPDQTAVLLTLTSGPIGTRPSVTWTGADALNTGNTNWSDALNWLTPGIPSAAENVTFNDVAVAGSSPFNAPGEGSGGIINSGAIDNFVDVSLTNGALNYANSSLGYHNTLVASNQTLTVNGSLTVNGAGGNVTILGSGGSLVLPANNSVVGIANGTASMLDLSGLDTLTATVKQIGVGFNPNNAGANVRGIWYLARTNTIATGAGNFGVGSALVIGGSSGSAGGVGTVYLGQSNALYVDGIVLGTSTSTGDTLQFNPSLATNPVAYIRGISGEASRVTAWSLGDDSVNLNNGAPGSGFISDFSLGILDAKVGTLIVGQGTQGNTANTAISGIFNMGQGTLDVTTLQIGVSGIKGNGSGLGGTGIGAMSVTGGNLIVNSLGLGVVGGNGGVATTTGTLNLTNATLVASNGIAIGNGTAGGILNCVTSTVTLLNGSTIGSPTLPLTVLNLDGGALHLGVNGTSGVPVVVATTVTTLSPTTINIDAIANVSGTVNVPLLSYTGADPYSGLVLGSYPSGYTVSLVDDAANSAITANITGSSVTPPTPRITSLGVNGATLNLSATNGAASGPYVLLGTTNLALPLNQWTPVLTNHFDASGNLNLSTNVINPALRQEFYILLQ